MAMHTWYTVTFLQQITFKISSLVVQALIDSIAWLINYHTRANLIGEDQTDIFRPLSSNRQECEVEHRNFPGSDQRLKINTFRNMESSKCLVDPFFKITNVAYSNIVTLFQTAVGHTVWHTKVQLYIWLSPRKHTTQKQDSKNSYLSLLWACITP